MNDGITEQAKNLVLTNPFTWVSFLVCIMLVVAIVVIGLYFLLRNKNIAIKGVSVTQKTQIQADARELSDNQMRSAKIFIGKLKISFLQEADRLWPNKTALEADFLSLLMEHINSNLLEQFRIDLVRNHIVSKTEDELKVYTQAKASMYRMKVEMFFNDYNRNLPDFDLRTLIDKVQEDTFYELYYKAYLSAKKLSIGY